MRDFDFPNRRLGKPFFTMLPQAQLLQPVYAYHTQKLPELFGSFSPDERFFQPYGNVNHLTWELGHLTFVRNTLIKLLNPEEKLTLMPDERALFAPGASLAAPEAYATPEVLLAEFGRRGERVNELLGSATEERWAAPSPFTISSMQPTVGGQLFGFLLHERMHLGEMIVLRNIILKNREALFAK